MVATPVAVASMFSQPYPGSIDPRGCSDAFDPIYCVYMVGHYLLSISVSQQGAGWVVTAAAYQ